VKQDRIKWNKKHAAKAPGQMIPAVVRDYIDRAPSGRALDIACGTGAVSLFMAGKGFRVDAVDISDVALGHLARQHPGIQTICADLDTFDLPENRYHLITNIRFLNRRLFPQIIKALVPGGLLIFETFMHSPDKALDRGFKREYLLENNELRKTFAALDILHYAERDSGCDDTPARLASLVGVKP
jgi:2-polyprenyl-3-methyl-5-hydroxy-6-metoxy-1,4-benzoquinol methylase